jgi:YD repeat-containing protein
MATPKKSKEKWPRVVRGSHLTVTTHQDGSTELVWDDEALLQEVRTAIAVYDAKQKSKHLEKYGIKTKGKY